MWQSFATIYKRYVYATRCVSNWTTQPIFFVFRWRVQSHSLAIGEKREVHSQKSTPKSKQNCVSTVLGFEGQAHMLAVMMTWRTPTPEYALRKSMISSKGAIVSRHLEQHLYLFRSFRAPVWLLLRYFLSQWGVHTPKRGRGKREGKVSTGYSGVELGKESENDCIRYQNGRYPQLLIIHYLMTVINA